VQDLTLVLVIATALVFDFVNGFHDAANSIATIVSTRVLSPFQAVAWAAFFNFIAFVFFGTAVAATIAKGVVQPGVLSIGVVFAGLLGAITWNVLTAVLGLPSSSSHALVGGIAGAAIAKSGFDAIIGDGIEKITAFIVFSPLLGLALGFVLIIVLMWSVHRSRRPRVVDRGFRVGQLFSAAAFSLGHGANDSQKTMGIILALLIGAGRLDADADVPLWVVLSAHGAIALGTMFGGWRIVRTMGNKLTRLTPMSGVAAETSAAVALWFTSIQGIPVSTTHTITGAITGVGSARRLNAVRWNVAARVLWAWILTIPGAAIVAAASFYVVDALS
jgi:PiT family inorganic phosphate transporter